MKVITNGRARVQGHLSPVRKAPGLLPTCSIPGTQYCGTGIARRMTSSPTLKWKAFFSPNSLPKCGRVESAGACLGDNQDSLLKEQLEIALNFHKARPAPYVPCPSRYLVKLRPHLECGGLAGPFLHLHSRVPSLLVFPDCKYTVHERCVSKNIPGCVKTYSRTKRGSEVGDTYCLV